MKLFRGGFCPQWLGIGENPTKEQVYGRLTELLAAINKAQGKYDPISFARMNEEVSGLMRVHEYGEALLALAEFGGATVYEGELRPSQPLEATQKPDTDEDPDIQGVLW